jgi:arsenite-transporting ATPase|tara:strand:- start:2419 stop:3339 length:921 start_codon:yes stop_codon:yes gene_type:complete
MTELFMVTGKGGVGKSTTSAATAIKQADSGKKVLLMSSDPAHNLGDLLECSLTNTEKEVIPNLWALEMDATQRALVFMNSLNEAFKTIFKKGVGVDVDLFNDMILPGLDEIFFCQTVLEEFESGKWDVIIADTPPSGQALRALTTPDILDAWLSRVLALKRKFEVMKGAIFKKKTDAEMENMVEGMKEDISKFKSIMTSSHSQIILVTIPEKLSVMETYRTVQYLNKLNLGVWGIIVNRIVPDFGEEWASDLAAVKLLHSQHEVHTESLQLAASLLGNMNIRQIPMVAYEPVGISNLRSFANLIWS